MCKFKGDPYKYRFFIAEYGSSFSDTKVIFRVREDKDPHKRAREKGIKYYDRLVECKNEEYIQQWLDSHPNYQLKKIIHQ